MTHPIDLEIIKDDLGITTDEHDDWFERRLDEIWAEIEAYTHRTLRAPPATFRDEWTAYGLNGLYLPIRGAPWPAAYLRQFPVTEIVSYEVGGEEADAELIVVERASGKLLSINGTPIDNIVTLYGSGSAITYKAGWDTLPANLYRVVLDLVTPLWSARQATVLGTLPPVSSISINDTGSIDFQQTKARTDAVSSILDPHTSVLDQYVSYPLASDLPQSSELIEEAS